jgi:CheY-like chemotaxis protein
MMPEMDGWEFLQRLRARPQTAATPVIVCSVINDPELAYSLGASLFLPKPIGRDDVLVALHQLGVV